MGIRGVLKNLNFLYELAGKLIPFLLGIKRPINNIGLRQFVDCIHGFSIASRAIREQARS